MTYTETTIVADANGAEIARTERKQATLLELKESDPRGYDAALETVGLMVADDWGWWETMLDSETDYIAEKYGITYLPKNVSFDLDRGDYFVFGKVEDIDARVLLKRAGIDLRSKDARTILEHGLMMGTHHTGFGDEQGWIGLYEYESIPDWLCSDDTAEKIRDVLRDAQNEMLATLRSEQYYRLSPEHLEELADINEWRFYENGALAR